jgi:EAL domain-containing protein (putative c-di-GMP-specific phosphodiesterase class I)
VPLAPNDLISIAEETGLIGSLGRHVMRSALEALAGWQDQGLVEDELWVSANLSVREMTESDVIEHLRSAASDFGLSPTRLRLEIDESALVALERSQDFLGAIREDGIGLHVDEFGTGYSSLTALHRLPIRALKIARSLVAQLDRPRNLAVARSVIGLAHSMDVGAIGSGIETAFAREQLERLGCDGGQGLYTGPVMEPHRMTALLERLRVR